jgi:O-succinylbenzoate synthase
VGGVVEARRVHDVCLAAGVPVCTPPKHQTNKKTTHNKPHKKNTTNKLPGDTSASSRYFVEDLTEPFLMDPDGTMGVPAGPGIGVEPKPERLAETSIRVESVTR